MFKDKMNFKLLNILIFGLIIYLGLITMDYWWGIISKIISIVTPFIIAFAIAYAFYPLVKLLKKKGISNGLAVTFITVSIVFAIGGLLAVTVPLVYDQLIVLSKMIGQVVTDFSNNFDVNLGDFKSNIESILNGIIGELGKYVSDGTIDFLGKSIDYLTTFIIVFIVSIYFMADMEKVRTSVKKFLQKRKDRSYKYIKAVDKELGQYVRGLTLFMLIHLVEYSLLFKIVGHPNWLLLGILAAITTIIPYFGGLITNVIAVILASVVSTNLFIGTIIICLIFPNIDGYIISPRVYGHTNKVGAMTSIFVCFAGGALWGITGIVVSLPLYIVLSATYKFFREDIQDVIEDIKDAKEVK